jgi:hypothetical protein
MPTTYNNAPTGKVTISGALAQNQPLTAANTLADLDGLGTIGYQWQVPANGSTWISISGATASTFTLTEAQVGKLVRVQASYIDGHGTAESVVSSATTAVTDHIIQGTDGADTLRGPPGAEVLDGKGGNDSLNGQAGNDTCLFGRGYGQDFVYDSGDTNDTVQMADDVTPSDVIVSYKDSCWSSMGATLCLSIVGASDQMSLDSGGNCALWRFHYGYDQGGVHPVYGGIEQVQFADGTIWNAASLVARAKITGSPINDPYLVGATGANTLAGGLGNDIYVVNNVGDLIVENADEGLDLVWASVNYTLAQNVENVHLTGSGNINSTGNELNNAIRCYYGSGNNVLGEAKLKHEFGAAPFSIDTLLLAAKSLGVSAKPVAQPAERLDRVPFPVIGVDVEGEFLIFPRYSPGGSGREAAEDRVLNQRPGQPPAVLELPDLFALWSGRLIFPTSKASFVGDMAKFSFTWWKAAVKIGAFEYTKYGTVPGRVSHVSQGDQSDHPSCVARGRGRGWQGGNADMGAGQSPKLTFDSRAAPFSPSIFPEPEGGFRNNWNLVLCRRLSGSSAYRRISSIELPTLIFSSQSPKDRKRVSFRPGSCFLLFSAEKDHLLGSALEVGQAALQLRWARHRQPP